MSELAWRLIVWMSQPSKLKGRALRFFFWITPRWLSKKFQMYMLRGYVERHPAEVERSMRESARATKMQHFPETGWSEEELVALYKQSLDLILHPGATAARPYGIRYPQARKRRFTQSGPHP